MSTYGQNTSDYILTNFSFDYFFNPKIEKTTKNIPKNENNNSCELIKELKNGI